MEMNFLQRKGEPLQSRQEYEYFHTLIVHQLPTFNQNHWGNSDCLNWEIF